MHRRQWSCRQHELYYNSPELLRDHINLEHMGEISQEHIQSFVALSERSADRHTNTPCPLCPEVQPLMDLEGHLAEHLESLALFVLGAEFDAYKNEEAGRSWSSTYSGLSSQLWSHSSEFLRGSQGSPSKLEGKLSDIGDDQTLRVDHHRAQIDIRRYARPFLNLLRRQGSTAPAEAEPIAELQPHWGIQRVVKEVMKKDQLLQRWFEESMMKTFHVPGSYVTVAVLAIRWHGDEDNKKKEHDKEVRFLSIVRTFRLKAHTCRLPSSKSSSSAILALLLKRYNCGHRLRRNHSTILISRSQPIFRSMIVPTASLLSTIPAMDVSVGKATTKY